MTEESSSMSRVQISHQESKVEEMVETSVTGKRVSIVCDKNLAIALIFFKFPLEYPQTNLDNFYNYIGFHLVSYRHFPEYVKIFEFLRWS